MRDEAGDLGRQVQENGAARSRAGNAADKALEENFREQAWLLEKMLNAFVVFESVFDGSTPEEERLVDARFRYINDAYEQLMGVRREEVLGRTAREVWPETEETWLKLFGEVAKTGSPRTFELYHGPTEKIYFCHAYRPWDTPERFCMVFEDITELRQAEEALRESETLLRMAERAAGLGGWSVNLAEMRVVWSDQVAAIHEMPPGYSPSVEEGMNFYAPEWRERVREVFEDCARDGVPYDEEMEILTAAGKRIWVRNIGEAMRDESGAITRVQGAFQEITLQKQAAAALQHRLHYEHLLSRVSTLAVESDDPWHFQSQCVALLGEGMGVSRVYVFRHDHDSDTMDNTHEWCAPGVEPQIEHLQGVPLSAVPWWVDTLQNRGTINFSNIEDIPDQNAAEMLRAQGILAVLVVPLFAEDRYVGFVGFDDCSTHRSWPEEDVEILRNIARIMTSVLEREEAEERLRAEHGQLLSIFDSIDEAIYITDPESYEVLFVNKAAKEMFGRDPTGGICYRELQKLEEPCSFCTNQIILGKPEETYLWEHHNPVLGRSFSLHDQIIRWPDGRDVRMELAIDITGQKRLEEQLRGIQRLEAVGQLAGGVAHDFNNLLSVILSYASFALEGLREGDPIRNDVLEIKNAGERGASLTRQLLAFSRKQVLEPRVVDLNEIVSEMEAMLRRLVGEDIEFAVDLTSDLGSVKVDPGQLEQVIMNLVVNARDAMPTGGKLTIETANVELDEDYAREHVMVTPGPYVLLAVSDTGCGMEEAVLQRVFEPFFTTKGLGKGTGLGLSTVYGIVKQSGGYVWAYSEPGQSSTFKVYLPRLVQAVEPQAVESEVDDPEDGTGTVLVVEDEDAVRAVAARMLRAAGYEVLTAANGGDALLLCEQHEGPIDLLITDVVMPRMSGPQLVKRLQQLRPDLEVLYMSGYTDNAIVQHGVLKPGTSFIGKPFSGNDLKRKVRQALTPHPRKA